MWQQLKRMLLKTFLGHFFPLLPADETCNGSNERKMAEDQSVISLVCCLK